MAVGSGGFIGSVLRYLIGLIDIDECSVFPIKTLFINVLGSFVLGLIVAYSLSNTDLDSRLVLFIKIGFCGGFTTFSTFALATFDLIDNSNYFIALAYILLSVVLSVLAVFAAELIIKIN